MTPTYPPAIAELLARPCAMPLGPGTPDRTAGDTLKRLSATTLFAPRPVADEAMAAACLSGLWLRFNFLDESHAISQDIGEAEGSFWHAIMHRREPDAGNSKYWWRKVGPHPVLDRLRAECPALGYAYTRPEDFVDFCERVRGSDTPDERVAERVELREWQFLFEHCWGLAVGSGSRSR